VPPKAARQDSGKEEQTQQEEQTRKNKPGKTNQEEQTRKNKPGKTDQEEQTRQKKPSQGKSQGKKNNLFTPTNTPSNAGSFQGFPTIFRSRKFLSSYRPCGFVYPLKRRELFTPLT